MSGKETLALLAFAAELERKGVILMDDNKGCEGKEGLKSFGHGFGLSVAGRDLDELVRKLNK